MKRKLPFAVLAATVAVPAIFAPTPGFAATNDEAKSGLYFSEADEKGAYYTFEVWSNLTQIERGILLTKYGSANVQVLLKAQGLEKITTLAAIADAGKPFNDTAVEYNEGDIEGTFTDIVTGEDVVIGEKTTPVVAVKSVSAINETSVTVSFPSNAEVKESDLTDKTIDFKAGDLILTAEFTSFNEDDKTAVFSLSEGSQFDTGTEYIVSGKNLTFTNDKFTYTNPNEEAADVVETLIGGLPEDRDLLDEGQKVLTVQKAYNELSDDVKELISADAKSKLTSTVNNFKLFTQAEANGIITAINNADTLDAKRALVNRAENNLEIAKTLGMTDAEFAHFNDFVQTAITIVAGLESVQAAVEVAEAAIAELPAEITLDDEATVNAAREAVDAALAKDSSATIKGLATLEAAETKIADLKKEILDAAIAEAISQISLIGNPKNLTLEDEAKVAAAEAKVEAAKLVGATDKAIVNLDHLQAARAQIETLKEELSDKNKAIQAAKVALTNLPIAKNITLADEEDVEAARTKYDLAIELGAKVEDFLNVWKLEEAEAKIGELNEAKLAAAPVVNAIDALPTLDELTLEDEAAVEAARAAFGELTKAQQAFVTNLNALEVAEAKIADLKETAQKLTEATEATQTYEALVDSAEKAKKLVTDREARLEAQSAFTKATNAIQELSSGEAKNELQANLDAANNIVIAASFVNSLQAATENLTEDTLMNANIKLTSTQGSVSAIKDETIKAALQELVNVEKEKISALERSIALDAAVQKADAAIAELPSVDDVTLADQDAVNAAAELVDAIVELGGEPNLVLEDYTKFFNVYNKIEELKANKELVDAAKEDLIQVVNVASEVLKEAVPGDAVGEYPQASYDSFTEAIADAQAVVDSESATVEEVNAAKQALVTAQATFEETVNVSALTAAIKAAEAAIAKLPVIGEVTTKDEAIAAEPKVEAAKNLIAEAIDLGATVDEIDGYADLVALERKIQELKNPTTPPSDVDKTELENLHGSVGQIGADEAKYTSESFDVFMTAFDEASAVLDNAQATEEQVTTAITHLETAIAGLKYNAEQTVTNTTDLEIALGEADVTTITFDSSFTTEEDVVIVSDTLQELNLAGTINGDLTVDTPNATVNNSAKVTGTINIGSPSAPQAFAKALAAAAETGTWNQNVSSDNIIVNTPVTLTVGAGVTVQNLTLDEFTILNVADDAVLTNPVNVNAASTIVSKKPVSAKIAEGTSVTVKKDANDEGTVVEGTGVVVQVVSYIASGEVSGLSNEVKFENGKFTVPAEVTEFTFKDGEAEVKATFANDKWTFKTPGASLEPTVEDKAAAEEVSTLITSLPGESTLLENGEQVVDTKAAFDTLTDVQKALVSDENKNALADTVKTYISFVKADISGLNVKVANESDIAKKQEYVDTATANLAFAKDLGFAGGEYDQAANQIADAQKQVTVGLAIKEATIKVGNDLINFTAVEGASAKLDLSELKPEATATVATVTASTDSMLTLKFKGVSKEVILNKGVNTLSANDLIPGLNPNTPLTISFLQQIANGAESLAIATTLVDTSSNETVTGTLTILIPAK
ncbi:hypothetical protein CSV80_15855 [Sporosarcina sp. P12(2017)]|uniref:FIVAR domain-containing protein n=1 Tax=unclassified Sporosarcina TaxID=2647733 RepID=UPI000C168288|nr:MULTISPECIES: FIVAR domain-containing protein [unclassified Sporosarcina]PIC56139.1 hypothetical protein CSV81_15860 [Sporosarcina sp. P10]PIC59467.1 hypothetical protein CSV80_15855 [Sporosarcina sp. P12(2017)]